VKDELLKQLFNDPSLKGLSLKLAGELSNDLLQEIGLVVCKKTDSEIEKLSGYFNFWCVRTMMNMCSNGKFKKNYQEGYLDYNELKFSVDYDHEQDEQIERIESLLDGLHWYKRDLFKLYLECGSLRKVEAEVGIDHCSVSATVREVKKEIKEKL
jgi:hypothetical protein